MTPPPPDWSSLLPALLDFERSPGRYRVVLREPRPLFEHTLAVLQLAVGRSVDGLADLAHEPAQTDELKRAARFFVRTVLLRPGVDHYTLLGLAPGCEADELREHYRLMIRLTHPDFAAGSDEAWPADAATRINQANDVLSSFERRSDYNAALASAQPVAAAAGAAAASAKVAQKKPATPRSRVLTLRPKKDADAAAERTGPRVPRGVKIALASLGALGAATALLLNGPAGDSGSLAVRKLPSVANPTLQAETSLVLAGGAASEAQVDTAQAPTLAPAAEPEPVAPQPKPRGNRTNRELAAAKAAEGSASGAPGEAALSLMMDTRMVVTPMAMPVSMTVAAAVPAPAPRAAAPAPAPTALPAEPAAPAASRAALPAPTLAQVEPVLSNLVASLPSGRGENMAQWIDSGFRAHPDTGRFVGRFNQLLAGQRVTQLGNVRFSSRTQGVQLVVDGVIGLHTQDMNNEARVRDLHLRAFFQPQDGQAVLTHLVAEKLQ